MSYERIDDRPIFDGPTRESHEYRYRVAARYVEDGDTVLDACCGTGYGKKILTGKSMRDEKIVGYFGIDKKPPDDESSFGCFDLEDMMVSIDEFPLFDVFVGLEAIEHLNDVGVRNFVEIAKRAIKTIVISTPIIPNSNPYHKQQFTKQDIEDLFVDDSWYLAEYEEQDGTYGIFIFNRV